jgi:hypothetical protein
MDPLYFRYFQSTQEDQKEPKIINLVPFNFPAHNVGSNFTVNMYVCSGPVVDVNLIIFYGTGG